MGNFWVVASRSANDPRSADLFARGLDVAARALCSCPLRTARGDWFRAAAFAREDGTGGRLAEDPDTGSALLAIGTWLHDQDYASGDELRLLRRYLEVGAERLAREIDGFFAALILDNRTREAIAISDLGPCHAFFRVFEREETTAFSGSSLLLGLVDGSELDPVSCQEFLAGNCVYDDRSLFQDVRKLPPASVTCFAPGRPPQSSRYWSAAGIDPDSLDGDAAVDAEWETLTATLRRIVKFHSRVACDLTGGYDSRMLFAALRSLNVPVTTIVSGDSAAPDVRVARGLVALAGVPLIHVPPKESGLPDAASTSRYTDGEFDAFEYAFIRHVHGHTIEGHDIAFTGSYGEFPRGYSWEPLSPHTGAYRKLDAARLARMRYARVSAPPLFRAELRLDWQRHFTDMIERHNAGLEHLPNTIQHDNSYLELRGGRWHGRIASSTNRVRAVLAPFIFRPLVETAFRIRTPFRRHSRVTRHMLARYQPDIARHPLEYGYPALPFRWNTAHLFWPIVPHVVGYYGSRIWERGLSALGIPRRLRPESWKRRLALWSEPEVEALLDPRRMRVAALVDEQALVTYLAASRQPRFGPDAHWHRLLALEMTLSRP